MNTPTNHDIKQLLDEIKANQQVLMNTSRKHLELYAQQIAKSDELNNQTFQLQKRNIETQRIVIIGAFAVVACIILYAFVR
ncbi:MAG: hypothetical protein HY080_11335 [Gammaproteobacteria bacterium]|nr:hypothetical protein [Gammaproteobacteria bacterium]